MEEEFDNNYAALADTIKIEDITSCEQNQAILYRLKDNDPTLTDLSISLDSGSSYYDNIYIPRDEKDLGWLGFFIGKNTTLQDLHMNARNNTDIFYRELSHNRSIRTIIMHFVGGRMFQMMDSFFKNNSNLTDIEIKRLRRSNDIDAHFFSRELKNYTKSLRRLHLSFFGQALDIITSLNMHTQLEEIGLGYNMGIGSNECTALSTLLRSTNQLQKLNLENNNIDDQGIDSLVLAIKLANVSSISQLRELKLRSNRSVTFRGWKQVASLLELPDCNLEVLGISHNNIGNEGARIFADALVNNSTLKTLDLGGNGITNEGWAPFLKLLCDKSTVNNTYLSNHTRQDLGYYEVVDAVKEHLNGRGGKNKVIMSKILRHHSSFDVQPFFEWELKVLPLMVEWFVKAAARTSEYKKKIRRMKLSVVYDFIKEFPMLYIEPMTRKEISGCTILEEKLLEEGRTSSILKQLAPIQEFKARALRRLSLPPTFSEVQQDGAVGAEFTVGEASSARQADENNETSTTRCGDGGEPPVLDSQYLISSNSILSDDPLESIVESCDEESEEGGSGASTQATLEARDAKDTTDSSGLATRRQSPLTTVPYKGSERKTRAMRRL